MQTTEHVITSIIARVQADVQARFPEPDCATRKAFAKAVAIVQGKHLQDRKDGTWHVRSQNPQTPAKLWIVNGCCTCPAALKDKRLTGKDKGVCKHRLAVKLATKLTAHFQSILTQQHTHYCTSCQSVYTCWQEPCDQAVDLEQCEACGVGIHAEQTDKEQQEATQYQEDHDMAHDPATFAITTDEPGSLTNLSSTLTAHDLATLAAPPYEGNPQMLCPVCAQPLDGPMDHTMCARFPASCGTDPLPTAIAMPEAPASINLQITMPGGHKLMYTARSMQQGVAGDQELIDRLPTILKALEGLSEPSAPEQPSWLYRIMSSFRPTSNQAGK